jgi:hypothetical protein
MQHHQKKKRVQDFLHSHSLSVMIGSVFCISLLLPAITYCQKSPRPKTSSSQSDAGAGGSGNFETKGFAQTKIPVFQNCALGMLKSDYYKALITTTSSIKTLINTYPFNSHPIFIANRLIALKLIILDTKQASDFSDLPAYFINKYGEPDYKNIKDTLQNLPSEEDSLVNKIYSLKQSNWIWDFKYYSINLLLNVTELSQNSKKGNAIISYTGNSNFYNLLKEDE